MKKDNKDVQLLKKGMWSRRMTAEITMIRKNVTESRKSKKTI